MDDKLENNNNNNLQLAKFGLKKTDEKDNKLAIKKKLRSVSSDCENFRLEGSQFFLSTMERKKHLERAGIGLRSSITTITITALSSLFYLNLTQWLPITDCMANQT